jgi:hypothetical protein
MAGAKPAADDPVSLSARQSGALQERLSPPEPRRQENPGSRHPPGFTETQVYVRSFVVRLVSPRGKARLILPGWESFVRARKPAGKCIFRKIVLARAPNSVRPGAIGAERVRDTAEFCRTLQYGQPRCDQSPPGRPFSRKIVSNELKRSRYCSR